MELEIAIINLISQIPMSIWLYDDGRTVVASTYKINYRKNGRIRDKDGKICRKNEQILVQQPRKSDD